MNQIDHPGLLGVEESSIQEWLQRGYQQITDYLVKHDAYVAYCAERGLEP